MNERRGVTNERRGVTNENDEFTNEIEAFMNESGPLTYIKKGCVEIAASSNLLKDIMVNITLAI
ncbi:hypothetical protein HNQ41_000523 [Texcoconibacillus texcoconensis]|uniref:Uncharacterized protein n=1 Tax=Texcoconibacillus texcoconensis TaxID=1095777 RepID=A0A840QLX5_9BACI|nr:hypothetical protein [Texcoconibacillus texcoconensis]